MKELDDKTHIEIQKLSESGDYYADNGDFTKALTEYWKAYDLIPEPKTDWEATTWVLAAIGDSNFLSGDFRAGVDNLSKAMKCPGAIGNPFLHMRLGQCQFELGNTKKAADELTRTYAIEGEGIFANDDPKYLEFLKENINMEKPKKKKKKPWWKF